MNLDYRFGYLHASETGYWVRGMTVYPIAETHVSAIIADPNLFGLATDDVQKTYRAHGEQVGTEAHAREELIRKAATNGWIRVRHYRRPTDYWSIQCSRAGPQREELLRFIRLAVEIEIVQADDEIRLTSYDDEVRRVYPFSEGGASRMIADLGGEGRIP